MQTNLFGAVLAFGVGVLIVATNYKLSQRILAKHTIQHAIMQTVRQWLQIIYLMVLLFAGKYTPWDRGWLLVGGVLGITLPMYWFSYRLLKLNHSLNEEK